MTPTLVWKHTWGTCDFLQALSSGLKQPIVLETVVFLDSGLLVPVLGNAIASCDTAVANWAMTSSAEGPPGVPDA